MQRITLAGLLKIELPGHTVRLTDGGTLTFDAESYTSKDALVGVPTGADQISEGGGDEIPAFKISFLVPDGVAAGDLLSQDWQGCRLRMWSAEIDEDTGLILGDPQQEVDAMIDMQTLQPGKDNRTLEVDCVASWQRLFDIDEGNLLTGEFHKRIHPGELGLDNATGVGKQFAWGTSSPRGTQ